MKQKKIVVDSLAQDVHAHALAWTLRQTERQCLHVFADNFPGRATIDLRVDTSGRVEIDYRGPEGRHTLNDEDDVVFLTRRCSGPILPSHVVQEDRTAAERESVAQLWNMRELLAGFPKCVSVNEIAAKRRADRKAHQLVVARQCGFRIPDSLFSNNVEVVREFMKKYPSGVIYKTNTPLSWKRSGEAGLTSFMAYSHLLQPAEVPTGEVVQISSGIFQAPVPKLYETRVTVMGSACFGLKLHSQESELTATDWRAGQRSLRSERIDVPQHIANACVDYLRRMGLLFGCFDFVVTPDHDWVFLECNEQGQWLWKEAFCPDLPLLDAYTQFISEPSAGFQYTESTPRFRFVEYQRKHWISDWRSAGAKNVMLEGSHVTVEKNAVSTAA